MKVSHWIFTVLVVFLSIIATPISAKQFLSPAPDNVNKDNSIHTEVLLLASEAESSEAPAEEVQEEDEFLEDEEYIEDEELEEIADPLEPVNRIFFYFNDKLYFWILKPVARGYSAILPERIRIAVRNFFDNIATPIRAVNSLLQFKVKPAGNELLRFGVNTTVGVLGFFDFARSKMGIQKQDEDFGQTLGVWGLGPVIYINWPFLGPSSIRDTLGYAGDYFLDPINLISPTIDRVSLKASDGINRTSLSIGDYEEIKRDALDPYDAVKDIYYQYRQRKIDR